MFIFCNENVKVDDYVLKEYLFFFYKRFINMALETLGFVSEKTSIILDIGNVYTK